jgi:hypothetical protein
LVPKVGVPVLSGIELRRVAEEQGKRFSEGPSTQSIAGIFPFLFQYHTQELSRCER